MGLRDIDENALNFGGKNNRYTRIDSDADDVDLDILATSRDERREEVEEEEIIKKGTTRNTQKYVLACAIFASVNSVLLGYGSFLIF